MQSRLPPPSEAARFCAHLKRVTKPPLTPTQKRRLREAIGLLYVRLPHAKHRADRALLEDAHALYALDEWA